MQSRLVLWERGPRLGRRSPEMQARLRPRPPRLGGSPGQRGFRRLSRPVRPGDCLRGPPLPRGVREPLPGGGRGGAPGASRGPKFHVDCPSRLSWASCEGA